MISSALLGFRLAPMLLLHREALAAVRPAAASFAFVLSLEHPLSVLCTIYNTVPGNRSAVCDYLLFRRKLSLVLFFSFVQCGGYF